jgi:hypothetical protein
MTPQEIQNLIDIIIVIFAIAGLGGAMIFVFWALSRPLPPWNELHGEEYKKYKKGEKGKSDNTD